MPCIVIWDKLDDPDLSYVGFDNFKATYAITEYLIGLRHRRIGLIIGPYSKVDRVRRRLEGFLSAMKDYGIPHQPAWIIEKEPTLIDGKEAMTRLMSMPERPTAVLAASDTLAVGAHGGRTRHGAAHPGGRVHRRVRRHRHRRLLQPAADHRAGCRPTRSAGWRSR